MIHYHIDELRGVVSSRMEGEITFDELLAWHEELWADERYRPHFSGIGDMRGAHMCLSPSEVGEMARINTERRMTLGRWALLVDAPRETALAVVYDQSADGVHEMGYFTTAEAASAYLGFDVREFLI